MICCVLLTGRHSVVYGFTLFNKSQSCPPTNISNLKEQHKHLINRPIIGSSSTTDTQKFFSFFFSVLFFTSGHERQFDALLLCCPCLL